MPTKNEILAVRALRQRKTRHIERKFTVEGHKVVGEALASGWQVHGVFCASGTDAPDAWHAVQVSVRDMERMSNFSTPPGVLAVMGMPDDSSSMPGPGELTALRGLHLGLDGLSDPGNLGTIIRTADWFGLQEIWASSDTVDAFNPKVVQASMGAVFRVGVRYVDLEALLDLALDAGLHTAALDLEGTPLQTADLASRTRATLAVLGSESHGLRSTVAQRCNERIHIPGGGASESLNAAVAASIVLAFGYAMR